ncbi:nicotinate phosphoribosyltransferase [Campylobacter sp. LR196d]|uniref:nicotinate phosphoribosyltransferase n=1 Tax=Campylobacter sp. LR196d TaxID=2593543 RepID=UPI001CC1F89B|nr:nicotinate phosphoribosyltransferase [Campylobacter sp. LR196d]
MKTFNLALLCDFYELTMAQGYFNSGKKDQISYFDIFFRRVPDDGGFAIFAGLESVLDFVENFHFNNDDIAYLKSLNYFNDAFLNFLKNFKFNGSIYAMNEGEIIFANEPILCIKATSIQAQLLETFLLLSLNHQSLIATKTNRIVRSAKNRPVLEFGARRAHGKEAAINGARAAIIGGCMASSCTLAAKYYNITPSGTMAHSWVQMFDNEYEAFCEYLKLYPNNPTLLIDTYNYKSGLENAIKVFKKFNILNGAIRIDSGDLERLSKRIRKKLNKANLKSCKIIVSNSLDEYMIENLLDKNAPIDAFGVGERLITASSEPIFGFVYKLVANEINNKIIPKIKLSEDKQKTIIPHFKRVLRFYDKKSKKFLYDKIFVYDEKIDFNQPYKELLKLVFDNGKRLVKSPNLKDISLYTKKQLSHLDNELLSLKPNVKYKVKLSKKLTSTIKNFKHSL